jgi:hypothetical protein
VNALDETNTTIGLTGLIMTITDTKLDPRGTPGRPSAYSSDLALLICEELADGRSLIQICETEGMPNRRTVQRWLLADAEFRQLYDAARRIGCDMLGEAAHDDAMAARGEEVPAARLRLDATKWYISKLHPRKWGDRLINEHGGIDGRPVVLQAVSAPMPPAEVREALHELLQKAEATAGLPTNTDIPDEERLKAVMDAGPIDPVLYRTLYSDGNKPA